MATRPHLIFPKPGKTAAPSRRGGGDIKTPTPQEQGERLSPRLAQLAKVLEQKRLALKGTSLGQEPHEVLVVETRGPPQKFVAAARTLGFGWLTEERLEEKMPPEHGFEVESRSPKKSSKGPPKKMFGHLYFVLANRTALEQLRKLFKRWEENPEMKLPRGMGKLKGLFAHAYDIRYWNEKDRLRSNGFFEDCVGRAEHKEDRYPFDAELWFKRDPSERQEIEVEFTKTVKNYGGTIAGQSVVLPEIAYHGILGDVPSAIFGDMGSFERHPIFQCHSIRFLEAVTKCSIPHPGDSASAESRDFCKTEPPDLSPIVALIDGVPLEKHSRLEGRIEIIDPYDHLSDSDPDTRKHGTAMASLICHGDLNLDGKPIRQKLCALPILIARPTLDGTTEEIPEGRLIVDQMHEAVRHLCESVSSIRVVNLSVCDSRRPFAREISPWARLLDWLSYEKDILFLVSAGNYSVSVSRDTGTQLPLSDLDCSIASIVQHPADRRLLAPAETVNGLTVGAIQTDSTVFDYQAQKLTDPFEDLRLPGLYSAHGPGYRKAIKPEILLPGGRELYDDFTSELQSKQTRPVGQKIATPGPIRGSLVGTRLEIGTSNATALAARSACHLHETLRLLREQNPQAPSPEHDTVLLKTLLVHGAGRKHFSLHQEVFAEHGGKLSLEQLGYYLGYGELETSSVQTCTPTRVTVLGVGALKNKMAHSFSFPFPRIVSDSNLSPRLIVTLAWLTPIKPENQEYRVAKLWFQISGMEDGDLSRVRTDQHMAQRGTVQHEIFNVKSAIDLRERNTADILVCCREEAGKIKKPIRYGLAVTFEINPESEIEIYQEIKERLGVTVGA